MSKEKEHTHGPQCGCGATDQPMYLHSKCHIATPTWAVISADGKTLTIECAACGKEVGTFQVVRN